MYVCEYGHIPLSIIGVISGGLMIFSASCLLNKTVHLAAFCAYAGKKTIWILLCHMMLNRLLAQFICFMNISFGINIQYWNQPFDIVFLLFGVFGSLLICQMWEKVCNSEKIKSIKLW